MTKGRYTLTATLSLQAKRMCWWYISDTRYFVTSSEVERSIHVRSAKDKGAYKQAKPVTSSKVERSIHVRSAKDKGAYKQAKPVTSSEVERSIHVRSLPLRA